MYVHVEPSMSSFMVRPVCAWIQPRAAEAAAGAALSRSDPATLNTMTARNSPKAARKARRVPGGAAEAWGMEGRGRGGDFNLDPGARIRWTVSSGQKRVDSDLGPSDLRPSDPLLMMTAVRPPEYFPRLEYAALLLAAERFVVADTFPFSRQGWQNRTRIRTPEGE